MAVDEYARALLHALARDEVSGRRSPRLTERFLVEQLPSTFTVYGNPWLVERTGVVYETDAIVVAPHAVFVIELKAYRGTIEVTDYDWYAPDPMKSPIALNKVGDLSHMVQSRLTLVMERVGGGRLRFRRSPTSWRCRPCRRRPSGWTGRYGRAA